MIVKSPLRYKSPPAVLCLVYILKVFTCVLFLSAAKRNFVMLCVSWFYVYVELGFFPNPVLF